ncbi:MAG: hypothetical protein BV457_07450 [Thermoplasmata archaeon M9B1D]|nr:MAG: hypothetical protein BV457_07450 [Thermoplasmata archaeon M9B1D]
MGYYSEFVWENLQYRDPLGLMIFVLANHKNKDKTSAQDFFDDVVSLEYEFDESKLSPLQTTLPVTWKLVWKENYSAKWYYNDEWVKWIAPFIQVGTLKFSGEEDGEYWGYKFENGNVKKISYQLTEVE